MAFKIWLVIICTVTLSGLFTFAYRASKSARRDIIKRRLMVDLQLIAKRHQLRLALSILVISYIQSVFGRNLAFYLHHPLTDYVDDTSALLRHRLFDIGHAATPDWSASEFLVSLNELWQYCMAAAVITTAMLPYIFELRPDIRDNLVGTSAEARESRRLNHGKIQTTNVVVRLLQAVALGHVLRMPTFLGTSLPGPSPHCIGALEAQNRPRDLVHILWFPHAGANCGDLVFSGHMLFATTALCLVTHYIDLLIGRPTAIRTFCAMLPLFAVQMVSILASRAHYTVDIVTGVTIASLFWVVQTKVLYAREWQPDATDDFEVKSATEVEEGLLLLGTLKTVSNGDSDEEVCVINTTTNNSGNAPKTMNIDKAAAEKAAFSDMYALAVAPLDPGVSLNSPGLVIAAQQHRQRAASSAKSTPAARAVAMLELPTFDRAGQTPLEIAIGRPECDVDDDGSNGIGGFALVDAATTATTTTNAGDVPQRESARRLQWEAEQSLPGGTPQSSRCSAQSTRSRRSATPARAVDPTHAAHAAVDV